MNKRQAVIALLTGVFFFSVCWRFLLIHQRVPLDGNMITLSYPNWVLARFFWVHRQLPLWNPFRDMGEPFLADPQSLVAYPLFWILGSLPTFFSFLVGWYFIHNMLAAGFAAVLAYHLYRRPEAAIAAALAFGFNGFFLSHVPPNVFASIAWMPAAIYFQARDSWRGVGVVMALQWLAGFPDFTLLTALVLLVLACRRGWAGVRFLFSAGGLALGLSSYQFIPFVEMFMHSTRHLVLDAGPAMQLSIPPMQLLKMIFVPQWLFFAPQLEGDPVVVSLYIGLVGLGLAAWGTYRGSWKERAWALGVASTLLLSLGNHLPGFRYLGFLHIFCYPAHWLLLSTLGLSLLSAAGVSHLARPRWKMILLSSLAVDLALFAQFPRIAYWDEGFLTTRSSWVKEFQNPEYPARLYHTSAFLRLWFAHPLRSRDDYWLFHDFLPPSFGAAFGIGDVQGHQVLCLQRAAQFCDRLEKEGPRSPLVRYAGISGVVTTKSGATDISTGNVAVLRLKGAFPPIFWAARGPGQKVHLDQFDPGHANARVCTPVAADLVFNQVAFPGWRCLLDGHPVPWRLFEQTFPAARISKGRHSVEWQYRSISFSIGLGMSLISLMFLGLRVRPHAYRPAP